RGSLHPEPHFELLDLWPAHRKTNVLALATEELARTDARIDQLAKEPGAIYRYLIEEALDIGQFVQQFSPRFERALRLVAGQAVAGGRGGPGPTPRLSVACYGAPGSGKKVLQHLATTLSPGAVVAQPEMLTAVGLLARVQQRAGSWSGYPGMLPRCSGSTL